MAGIKKITGIAVPSINNDPWIKRFRMSEAELGEIQDGPNKGLIIGMVTIPTTAEKGNKGNSIMRCALDDVPEVMAALKAGIEDKDRVMTTAEVVSRTMAWEEEDGRTFLTFRSSMDKGSRTHRIPAEDVDAFIATVEGKMTSLSQTWDNIRPKQED